MKTQIIDLRGILYRDISRMIKTKSNSETEVLILIGHGTLDGTQLMGLSASDILELIRPKLIMFYACNCGKSMVRQIAKSGLMSFGFITNIMIGNNDKTIEIAFKVLSNVKNDAQYSEIMDQLRDAWFENAIEFLGKGCFLDAAILNHCRLSIRYG